MFQVKILQILTTTMYYMDLFKSPLTLMFKKKRFISTKFGFFCSMGIFVSLTVMVVRSDVFQKLMPQIWSSNLPSSHRPLINFDRKIIAIGVQDDLNFKGYIDPSVYTIKVSNLFYNSDPSGGYKHEIIEKKLHVCSAKDFDDPLDFENLGLANNFCFEKSENLLELEGFFDEPMIKYAMIELFLCDNKTQNNSCKSFDSMKQSLNGKTFNIYFQDSIVDTKNYLNPIQKNTVNQYLYIDVMFRKNLDLYFQTMNLLSDDGWMFENWTKFNDSSFAARNSDFFSVSNTDFETSRFAINIYSGKNTVQTQRSYIKISDLLAKLGGVMQSMMLFAYILIFFEHSLFLKNTILNSLFTFYIKGLSPPKTVPKLSKKIPFKKTDIAKEASESSNNNFNPLFIEKKIISGKMAFQTVRRKTMEIFDLKKNNSQKLKLSMFEYLIMKMKSFLPFCKMNYSEQLFKKSEKIYEKEVDYIDVLKKLQDIDKLKQVLLNRHQYILFDFLAKPMIHLNDPILKQMTIGSSINLEKSDKQKKESLKQTLDYYENLKVEHRLSEIDERLFDILQSNIKKMN